jgi:uncharacterized protein YdbL (DUF1318 family)
MVMMLSLTSVALAQSYDIKAMTPEVTAALEARKERFSELKELKAKGFVGENNRGYVEVMGGGTEVSVLVNAENADRKVVYLAIVEQNQLGERLLPTVESIFAGVQRDKAAAGEKIQDPRGSWVTK